MIQFARKRLPFLATGFAFALSCMPLLGEDKAPFTPGTKTTTNTTSTAKQVTLSGKVVDLHQYMTGERSESRGSIDRTPDRTPDRTTPADRLKPTDTDAKNDAHKQHAGKMKNQIMGLETTTGLVLICFDDAPGVFATPRVEDQPRTTPANPTNPNDRPKLPTTPGTREKDADKVREDDKLGKHDSSHWTDKQVEVSGSLYEKNGIKFLVVTRVSAALDNKSIPKSENPTRIDPSLPRPQ